MLITPGPAQRLSAHRPAAIKKVRKKVTRRKRPPKVDRVELGTSSPQPKLSSILPSELTRLCSTKPLEGQLADIRSRLKALEEPHDKAAQLKNLLEISESADSPIVKRIASMAVHHHDDRDLPSHTTWEGRLLREGEPGLADWLAGYRNAADNGFYYQDEGGAELRGVLTFLDERQGPLSDGVLRPLLHMIDSFSGHHDDQAEASRELVAGKLEQWWTEGRFQVSRDERKVFPGAVKLSELGRPGVLGNTIRLESPSQRTPIQSALHAAFESEQGANRWRDMLEQACSDPDLKQQFSQHREELFQCLETMTALGKEGGGQRYNRGLYEHYSGLMKLFPESVTTEFLDRVAHPLNDNSGPNYRLLLEACELRPELYAPTWKRLQHQSDAGGGLESPALKIFKNGIKAGALTLDQDDLEFMARRLYRPPLGDNLSAFERGFETEAWVEPLLSARRQKPDLFAEFALPGPDLKPIPFELALLEQVFDDSGVDAGALGLEEAGFKNETLLKTLELIESHPRAASRMLEVATEGLEGQDLKALSERQKVALLLLERDRPGQVDALLGELTDQAAPEEIEGVVERVRSKVFARELQHFSDSDRVGGLEQLMRLAHACADGDLVSERGQKAFEKAGHLSQDERHHFLARLDDLANPETRSSLHLLWLASDKDAALRQELHHRLDGQLLRTDLPEVVPLPELRLELFDAELKGLAQTPATEVFESYHKLSGLLELLPPGSRGRAAQAAAEGLDRSTEAQPFTRLIGLHQRESEKCEALAALEQVPQNLDLAKAAWAYGTLAKGTDDAAEARDAFLRALSTVGQDEDWQPVLQRIAGGGSVSEHTDIEFTEDAMWVGDTPVWR